MKKLIVRIIVVVIVAVFIVLFYQQKGSNLQENIVSISQEPQEIVPFVIQNNAKNKEINENTIGTLENGLPILMYHFFYDESAGETGADSNWMEISAFREQMKYLSENNFYFPSWQEVRNYVDGVEDLPAKSIVITVDDGDPSFFYLGLPILEEYNILATSFVITSAYEDFVNTYNSPNLRYETHSHNMHRARKRWERVFPNSNRRRGKSRFKNINSNC